MIDFDNTIGKSFNKDFCAILEYHLSRNFSNSDDTRLKHFWCDGISYPEAERQNWEKFHETHEITTGAWLGTTGQDEYEMIIKLGKLSFERCLKGLDLKECLPGEESLLWVNLDEQNREIVLQLL